MADKKRKLDIEGVRIMTINSEGEVEECDLNTVTKEQLITMLKESITKFKEVIQKGGLKKDVLEDLDDEEDKSRQSFEEFRNTTSMIKINQELEANEHSVEKNKVVTLFDIIANTKELIANKVTDTGVKYNVYNIDTDVENAANNVIKLALKQSYHWIEKNNLNKLTKKEHEKDTNNPNTNTEPKFGK